MAHISQGQLTVCSSTGTICTNVNRCPIVKRMQKIIQDNWNHISDVRHECSIEPDAFVDEFGMSREEVDHAIFLGFVPLVKNVHRDLKYRPERVQALVVEEARRKAINRLAIKMQQERDVALKRIKFLEDTNSRLTTTIQENNRKLESMRGFIQQLEARFAHVREAFSGFVPFECSGCITAAQVSNYISVVGTMIANASAAFIGFVPFT